MTTTTAMTKMMVTTKADLCHVNWHYITLLQTCLKNLRFYNTTIPNTIHIIFFIQKFKITNTTHKLNIQTVLPFVPEDTSSASQEATPLREQSNSTKLYFI